MASMSEKTPSNSKSNPTTPKLGKHSLSSPKPGILSSNAKSTGSVSTGTPLSSTTHQSTEPHIKKEHGGKESLQSPGYPLAGSHIRPSTTIGKRDQEVFRKDDGKVSGSSKLGSVVATGSLVKKAVDRSHWVHEFDDDLDSEKSLDQIDTEQVKEEDVKKPAAIVSTEEKKVKVKIVKTSLLKKKEPSSKKAKVYPGDDDGRPIIPPTLNGYDTVFDGATQKELKKRGKISMCAKLRPELKVLYAFSVGFVVGSGGGAYAYYLESQL